MSTARYDPGCVAPTKWCSPSAIQQQEAREQAVWAQLHIAALRGNAKHWIANRLEEHIADGTVTREMAERMVDCARDNWARKATSHQWAYDDRWWRRTQPSAPVPVDAAEVDDSRERDDHPWGLE